jgi:hypothetical protein
MEVVPDFDVANPETGRDSCGVGVRIELGEEDEVNLRNPFSRLRRKSGF